MCMSVCFYLSHAWYFECVCLLSIFIPVCLYISTSVPIYLIYMSRCVCFSYLKYMCVPKYLIHVYTCVCFFFISKLFMHVYVCLIISIIYICLYVSLFFILKNIHMRMCVPVYLIFLFISLSLSIYIYIYIYIFGGRVVWNSLT